MRKIDLPWHRRPVPEWARRTHGNLYQIQDLKTERILGRFVGESRAIGLYLNYAYMPSLDWVVVTLC